MKKQRDFFKRIHPEQFSDTKIVKVGQLDRDFFSYFLETLTNESREKDFEVFCRKLAEVEICPNLLPQTGPTGGGDSKVDSETYPVAETLASTWYYGYGSESQSNRWAFAISAKKDWKPKVKSDVNKIVKVNTDLGRGYTKVFFMTNQYVSDKKRAETEDELRKQHNMDVRILDKVWLLEKVFTGNNKDIAIECFHLSDSFRDEKQIGSMDMQRIREFQEIETALRNPTEIKKSKCLALAKRSIILGRQLELPKERMIGILERAQSLSIRNGMKIDESEVGYQYAWTIFWWYPDNTLFYKKYKEYEALTLEDSNVERLINLRTLWMNLFSASKDEPKVIPIKKHTDILINEHQKYINDNSRPNAALGAKASFQMVRTLLGEDIDDILKEFIDIINSSEGNLDFDLYTINKLVMDTPIYKRSKHYNEIFELLIDKMGKRSRDLETAKMLIKRGVDVSEDSPYKAIQYFSRSLRKLFNEDSKDDLIYALVNMASSFEQIGLHWAARNFYMYVFYLCINQYLKFGEMNPALIASANQLKFLELRFGRIIYSIEFDHFENIARHLYPKDTVIDQDQNGDLFDYILGIQLFKINFSDLAQLEYFPENLSKRGLPFSSIAMKYELGHYDEEMLKEFDENKEAFDDFVSKWYNQPAKEQMIGLPWFGFEDKIVFTSKILGCKMRVISPNNSFCMELGSSILASMESFFVTGMQNNLIPMSNSITFKINYVNTLPFQINWETLKGKRNHIGITCSNYLKEDSVGSQSQMQDFLIEILGYIVSILFPYKNAMGNIEEMIKNENAFDRSQTFSNSIFYVLENIGTDTFAFSSIGKHGKRYELLRTGKVRITENEVNENSTVQLDDDLKIHYDQPPEDLNFENTSQDNISISSIINVPLWDKAQWKGILFLSPVNKEFPPVLSPMYFKEFGMEIFSEWITEYGTNDLNDEIQIGIIKGIDKKHPYWYRVIIGNDIFKGHYGADSTVFISNIQRLHTMQATNTENLNRFEASLESAPNFTFVPSLLSSMDNQPKVKEKYAITKNKSSIVIRNASDIKETDYFLASGIMPDDDPVIPKGINTPAILKIINEKKRIQNKHQGLSNKVCKLNLLKVF